MADETTPTIEELQSQNAELRKEVEELNDHVEFLACQFTAFLDEKYERILRTLYEKESPMWGDEKYWLDPPEIDEAFTDFVKYAIDIAWDMSHDTMKFAKSA